MKNVSWKEPPTVLKTTGAQEDLSSSVRRPLQWAENKQLFGVGDAEGQQKHKDLRVI